MPVMKQAIPEAPGHTAQIITVNYGPGQASDAHMHPGSIFAYVLEGEIVVTPKGGEPVRIVPGDLVVFPAGLDSQWEVVKPLRKHYKHG